MLTSGEHGSKVQYGKYQFHFSGSRIKYNLIYLELRDYGVSLLLTERIYFYHINYFYLIFQIITGHCHLTTGRRAESDASGRYAAIYLLYSLPRDSEPA